MDAGAKPDRRPKDERRAFAVLLAAFALIVQLMIPSAVMAAQMAASGEIICTGVGVETVRLPAGTVGEKAATGLPCPVCLAPVAVALPAPSPTVVAVAYSTAWIVHHETADTWVAPARPPPRPPGQAPPASNV